MQSTKFLQRCWCWNNGVSMKPQNFHACFIAYTKINLTLYRSKRECYKHESLQENIKEKIYDLREGMMFLDRTQIALTKKDF